MLWYHDPHGAVWLRWNENGGLLSPRLSWCPERQPGADDNACVLFAGHPAPHSWDVVDPLMYARAAKVAAQLGLPFG
ncbi:hypothetical protein ABZ383_02410 [Streptomyces sp. NPDC005900]|uniref:hypothetical protein n=1 Tax=Streptomyces sp. NPDC005900 TaxID=3154569 RepID=UPI0033ECAE76